MSSQFSDQFQLSITRALGDQLAEALEGLDPTLLTKPNLAKLEEQAVAKNLPSRSGVYQLFRGDELIYIGKADKPLAGRLENHRRKIAGRRNISIEEMSFRCLYVAEDFTAVAPEKLLIKKHKADGGIPWNTNGFGNKDPGRNRDNSVLKANHFDVQFPIDVSRMVRGLTSGEQRLVDFLEGVKDGLPYNFRYEEWKGFEDVTVTLPERELSADEAFRLIAIYLPDKWQVSALMGYVIMYEDNHRSYAGAWRYYRRDEVLDSQIKTKASGKTPSDDEESEE
ncbi:Eco29kI family restriction endonuclease [Streptomyces sp. NPDC002458]|uniref:Eco29kI family restriction endonuclease n=1 Tax=Streptomyces sp. NPDC002458 TaxID=3364644 RepID=UPI0036A22A83